MELTNFNSEKKYSSKFLVEQINIFRKEEGNNTELLHKNLLVKIESEFDEEIGQLKIQPSSYLAGNGKQEKCYELTFEQALQILMSESKSVRKKCVEVLKAQQQLIESFKVPKTLGEALILAGNLALELEEKSNLLLEQAPKVEFYNQVADGLGTFDLREVSAMLKLSYGRNTLFRKLRDLEVLQEDNLPYRSYIDRGYFHVVETKWNNPKTEEVNLTKQTRITQKGLDWLVKNKEILNTVE